MPLAAGGSSSSALPIIIFIVLIGGMYLLMIRPQQRRNRQIQQMQSTLGVGDEVMTGSGMYGTVLEIDEAGGTVLLEVAPEVDIRYARGAIARVLTPAADRDGAQGSAPSGSVRDSDGLTSTPHEAVETTGHKVIEER